MSQSGRYISNTGPGGFVETLTGDTGGAVSPFLGNIDILGGHDINTVGNPVTHVITVNLDNAITLGDLSNIATGSNALTIATGDLSFTATNNVGNLNLAPCTSAGTSGIITTGGSIVGSGPTDRLLYFYGNNNIFYGYEAGNLSLDVGLCAANIGFGFQALESITGTVTGASYNVAIGSSAMNAFETGNNNVCIGLNSAYLMTTGCTSNIFIGGNVMGVAGTDIVQNTVIGTNAYTGSSGSYNTIYGYGAGANYAHTESSNILIQNAGVVSESNVIHIGTQGSGDGEQNACYIAGIYGATVTGSAVLCSSTGQLGTIASSIRFKENIENIAVRSEDILSLRPVVFNYKSDETKSIHYGLIAEEVEEIFPDLVLYGKDGKPESVAYHELPVLLLNELKRALVRIDKLEELIAELI